MGKNGAKKSVLAYVFIAFALLSALFGMNIMSFIFGQLGNSNPMADVTQTVTNETEAYINTTGYTIDSVSQSNFTGSATLTAIWGVQGGLYNISIPLVNATLTSSGVLTNATATEYSNVSISYTSAHKTNVEMDSIDINNASLQGIKTYAEGSTTQFNVLSIAIILILLVGVFMFFWNTFMKRNSGKEKGAMGGTFG